ncbi:phage/plasmid primase, P4 family [Planktothricoides raciborskii]|uniref:phage/plasmid primase, P4 family n=1 Tax=Planktothricoides raciborskii TaxID=132608 RepID=UPI00339CDEB6
MSTQSISKAETIMKISQPDKILFDLSSSNNFTTKDELVNLFKGAHPLIPDDLLEWMAADLSASAIAPEIALANFKPVYDDEKIAQFLGWKSYKGEPGWLSGDSLERQFKPRKPLLLDGKPAKYLTSKGGYDAALLKGIDWDAIADDPTKPIIITEGAKKAASLISQGLIAVSLPGVNMGHLKGGCGTKLVPGLDLLARSGRHFCIAFDADIVSKPQVRSALKSLAETLINKDCTVSVWTWDISIGKGIDDVIANGKYNQVKETQHDVWLQKLEKQFNSESRKGDSKRSAVRKNDNNFADEIAEEYQGKLIWESYPSRWMMYGKEQDGMWSEIHSDSVNRMIVSYLDVNNEAYTDKKVKSISALLRIKLSTDNWKMSPDLIPYRDGVFDLKTNQLKSHSPGYRFTWQLPYPYQSQNDNWNKINEWLDFATQNNQRNKQTLIAYMAATLRGRSDLQKFLYLQGHGGSGKGTFIRLLVDLIGKNNIHSSSLSDWNGNRFETANAYQKRLTVFPDEDSKVNNYAKFLKLTGQDDLRAEEKGKKAFCYRYDGMVVMASNKSVFVGGASSAIARRMILVPFNAKVNPSQVRDLNADFQDELPAFSRYLLSLDNRWISRTLKGDNSCTGLITSDSWETQFNSDGLAAWFDECVVVDQEGQEQIGSKKADSTSSLRDCTTLYESYTLYCYQNNYQPKNSRNFSTDLLELTQRTLGLDIKKQRNQSYRVITGLRLRNFQSDKEIPTYGEILESANEAHHHAMSDGMSDTMSGGMSDETLAVTEDVGCVGSSDTSFSSENTAATKTEASASDETSLVRKELAFYTTSLIKELEELGVSPEEVQSKLTKWYGVKYRPQLNIQQLVDFSEKLRTWLKDLRSHS